MAGRPLTSSWCLRISFPDTYLGLTGGLGMRLSVSNWKRVIHVCCYVNLGVSLDRDSSLHLSVAMLSTL